VKHLSFSHKVSPDVSAGQCLKLCDDTPFAATLPNLFQQDGVPAHRSRHTVAYLHSNVPEFTEPENWPPNSPDLNQVDYAVWGALQQMVYRRKISDIDQLKRVLIDCWAQISQDTLNRAIDQLPKRLMMVSKQRVPTWSFVWTNSVGK